MKLKNNILKKIKKNAYLKRALMDFFDRSQYTVDRWLNENNPCLTQYQSLQIICIYLKIDIQELVEECTEDLKPVFQT